MNIVVTGANRGIGLELTRHYLGRGDQVHAGARSPERAEALAAMLSSAAGRLTVAGCDVGSDRSVRSFAASVKGPVDLLINNAGVRLRRDGLLELDLDEANRVFQVNALGPLRVTRALAAKLGDPAKVVNVSSHLASLEGNDAGGAYGYRMSKAALNMATRSLAPELAGRGIVIVALSPGWVQTAMGGSGAPTPVAESVNGLISVIDGLTAADSGSFFGFRGESIDW